MARRTRVTAPVPRIGAGFEHWAEQVSDALNVLPNFSIDSTSNGPESVITGDSGTILVDIGSSNTTYWAKLSGDTTTGWAAFDIV